MSAASQPDKQEIRPVFLALVGFDDDTLAAPWLDESGCWADEYYEPIDQNDACGRPPDPRSRLGLCTQHMAELTVEDME